MVYNMSEILGQPSEAKLHGISRPFVVFLHMLVTFKGFSS